MAEAGGLETITFDPNVFRDPYEHSRFGRVVTAMVTPFAGEERGRVNYDAAQDLAQYLIESGSEGLVLGGTTGESPVVTPTELRTMTRAVFEAVGPTIPIIVGTGSNDPSHAESLTQAVTRDGLASGLLVVSPYYSRPPQEGITDYFREIAGQTDLPVLMYNIPVRTGRLVEPDTIKRLADVPNIVGVKDATGDVAMAVTISRETPDDFSLYSGEDGLNLRLAQEAGAVGTVSVASHWAGLIMGTMYEALADNDLSRAEQVNEYLEPSYAFESGAETPNPIPSKAILRGLGLAVGYCRPPMIPKKLDDQWRAVEADLEHRGVQIHQELMEAMAA